MTQSSSPPSEPLSAEGSALLDAGRPLDAVEVLRQGVAVGEPSAPDLLVRAYFESGSWYAAAEWLTVVVDQGDVRFAGRLGVARAELGDRAGAESMLRLAVESGEVTAANDLAILLRDEGRTGEAAQVLVQAAEAGDELASANLVELHLEEEDLPAAREAAERYADETRPDTLVALADLRALEGRTDDADGWYRKAGELGALRAHIAYSQFLVGQGDPEGAERELREAEQREEPGWAYALGRFLLDQGRPDEARAYLQLAIDSGDAAARQAMIELDGGDQDD
ncbi:tetratricopeptide repeat protein [Pseudonocardia sp. CA-142604]|uniref:tetratricopeptide repeat protein n=1 Tax=Pseudonocardia sp. CA-142604 TaxID=3240024 RepID=UPI003D93E093